MKIIYIEFLKLKTKARSWMGPILVFWLILIAYPLTVEFLKEKLVIGFFSVLWIAILISMMFAAEDIFTEDYNDGTLEQTMIVNSSFSLIVGVKIFIYWLFIGIPISLLSFIFSLGTSENLIISNTPKQFKKNSSENTYWLKTCLLYTSPSPRDS